MVNLKLQMTAMYQCTLCKSTHTIQAGAEIKTHNLQVMTSINLPPGWTSVLWDLGGGKMTSYEFCKLVCHNEFVQNNQPKNSDIPDGT